MNKLVLCILTIPMLLGLVAPNEVNVKNEVIPAVSTCEMDPSFAAWLGSVGIDYDNYQMDELYISKKNEEDLLFDKIDSLKGLECFTNVNFLRIHGLPSVKKIDIPYTNNFKTIIVLESAGLEELSIVDNEKVEYLHISDSHALRKLRVVRTSRLNTVHLTENNMLSTIELQDNTALKEISLNKSESVSTLDLSNHSALEDVRIFELQNLKGLNLSGNVNLNTLMLSDLNIFEELDLSSNSKLQTLYLERLNSLRKVIQPSATSLRDVFIWETDKLTTLNLDKQKQLEFLHLENTVLENVFLPDLTSDYFGLSLINNDMNIVDFAKFDLVDNFELTIGGLNIAFLPESVRSKIGNFSDVSEYINPYEEESKIGKNTTELTYLKTKDGYEIDLPSGILVDRMQMSNEEFVLKGDKLLYQGNDFDNAIKDLYYDYLVDDEFDESGDFFEEIVNGRKNRHRMQYLRVYPTFIDKAAVDNERPSVIVGPNGVSAPPTGDSTNQGILLLLGLTALVFIAKTYKKYTA